MKEQIGGGFPESGKSQGQSKVETKPKDEIQKLQEKLNNPRLEEDVETNLSLEGVDNRDLSEKVIEAVGLLDSEYQKILSDPNVFQGVINSIDKFVKHFRINLDQDYINTFLEEFVSVYLDKQENNKWIKENIDDYEELKSNVKEYILNNKDFFINHSDYASSTHWGEWDSGDWPDHGHLGYEDDKYWGHYIWIEPEGFDVTIYLKNEIKGDPMDIEGSRGTSFILPIELTDEEKRSLLDKVEDPSVWGILKDSGDKENEE